MINDQFVVNPTTEQMEDSELDLMMAGTDSAILMIEVCAQLLFAVAHIVSPDRFVSRNICSPFFFVFGYQYISLLDFLDSYVY
jgi:hypothetical protein